MDWLDLLAVQGTLKSLLQYHSSKAPILWCSAFFTVQLSHPYMTTGKTIALTRQTFVGKVMSLFLNMLSRLDITWKDFFFFFGGGGSRGDRGENNQRIQIQSIPEFLLALPGITQFNREGWDKEKEGDIPKSCTEFTIDQRKLNGKVRMTRKCLGAFCTEGAECQATPMVWNEKCWEFSLFL